MAGIVSDTRYAARMLRKSPGFTAISIFILVLGIGANTAIFSIINALLLRPLPYRNPEQLVLLWESAPQFGFDFVPTSEGGFLAWRERSQVFSGMALFSSSDLTLTGVGDAERISGMRATWELFDVLGVQAQLGRVFAESESSPGGEEVVLLTHGFWNDRFSRRPDVLGQRLVLDGTPRTVVGVLPPDFLFPPPVDILGQLTTWNPQFFLPAFPDSKSFAQRGSFVVARLKPGLSLAQAEDSLGNVAASLVEDYPESYLEGAGALLAPLHNQAVSGSRTALMVLVGAVAFILLIACLNVANLLLARGIGRQREVSIRIAVGASRGQVVRQLLVESLLLALVSAGGGLIVAELGLSLMLRIGEGMLPSLGPVEIDQGVLAFTFLTGLATALFFGLVPALQLSSPNLHETLKEGGRGNSSGLGPQRLRKALVVLEVALALTLLVGAGLLLRSFSRLQKVNLGFVAENVLSFGVYLPPSSYRGAGERNTFYRRALQEVASIPGVASSAAAHPLPLSQTRSATGYIVEGQEAPDPQQQVQITDRRVVTAGYFEAMRIPIMEGRGILESDQEDGERVTVINQSLARRHWPGRSPVGSRISIGSDDEDNRLWWRIVGVAGNVKHTALRTDSQMALYVPLVSAPPNSASIIARSQLPEEQVTKLVRARLATIDPNVALRVLPVTSLVSEAQAVFRAPAVLLAIFAGLALTLAVAGLYGVLSFLVSQRTQEIGVRMALGASSGSILSLVFRQIGLLVGVGILLGLTGGYAASRGMRSLLFETSPGDPRTLGLAALVFFVVAVAASLIPARRAARTDPLVALRVD